MKEWQSIETLTPSEGEVLLATEFFGPGDWRIKVGSITEDGTIEIHGASWAPSHWMPLPNPPNSECNPAH